MKKEPDPAARPMVTAVEPAGVPALTTTRSIRSWGGPV